MEALLSDFTYLRTYARYIEEAGRRETYPETVKRNISWIFADPRIPQKVKTRSEAHVLNKVVFPSMRGFWSAGKAADKDNALIYNCSFLGINSLLAFSEALYLLMCGTGVGFSVEQRHISLLPKVEYQRNKPVINHTVADSREGWQDAFNIGLNVWFLGGDCYFDYSKLRPKGAPLKTMGGRSSGGDVFRQLLEYTRGIIFAAQGRKLTALECHNIMCQVGAIVIVGGTRRSALISLSDLRDEIMRNCKQPGHHPRLYGANNSAVYYEKPTMVDFMDEWVALAKSGMGERGIANLWAARKRAPHRRKSKLIQGVNPCGEVALRDKGFCNLTSVVVKPDDDFESLRDKITSAAWIGTCQASFTHFPFLSPEWKENAEEERLCGISLSGQQDNPGLLTPDILQLLKAHATNVCRKASKILDINMPAAITTTKPEGTCSLVAGSSAGAHPRWSEYYVKSVQISVNDPLFHLMADQDVPYMIPQNNGQSTAIIGFPIKSPEGAITRHDMSAIDQLEWYLRLTENYVDHNVSNTVYVGSDEWLKVANWVYDHFDKVCGISFFPKETGAAKYDWLPFREIDKNEYDKLRLEFPDVDFSKLPDYEKGLGDVTEGAKELACAGGACEI
jgi:ribonucleoside-triphosphate reductase